MLDFGMKICQIKSKVAQYIFCKMGNDKDLRAGNFFLTKKWKDSAVDISKATDRMFFMNVLVEIIFLCHLILYSTT